MFICFLYYGLFLSVLCYYIFVCLFLYVLFICCYFYVLFELCKFVFICLFKFYVFFFKKEEYLWIFIMFLELFGRYQDGRKCVFVLTERILMCPQTTKINCPEMTRMVQKLFKKYVFGWRKLITIVTNPDFSETSWSAPYPLSIEYRHRSLVWLCHAVFGV